MKTLIITIVFLLSAVITFSQTVDELFRQKEAQKKYLLKQIAALQTHLKHVKKGIAIAQKGLSTISQIKHSDLDMHEQFFNALKTINPEIKKHFRIAETVALQLKVIKIANSAYANLKETHSFTPEELNHISKVFSSVLNYCANDLQLLTDVLTPDIFEMKDDQRFEKIDMIYNQMQKHYGFIENFKRQARILAIQRMKENNDINASRTINGIKK